MANRRTLRFMTYGDGCLVCVSHRLNQDGYFRKMWADGLEMFHRFIYRAVYGGIPAGHEIDHMCGFRACVNPKHLRCISRAEHLAHTNKNRILHRDIVGLLPDVTQGDHND